MTSSPKPSKALTIEAIAMSPLDDIMSLDWEHAVAAVVVAVSVVETLFRVVLDVEFSGTVVTVNMTRLD